MAGPISIPPNVNYRSPLISTRARWREKPAEGDRCISAAIQWTTDGGPGNAVGIDCAQGSPVAFSQICALYVDNLNSDSNVNFIFIDTQFELTVPARSEGLFPVQTGGLSFVVVGINPGPTDVVYFQIYNSLPPPVAIQSNVFQSFTGTGVLGLTSSSNVFTAASGVLQGAMIVANGVLGGAGAGTDLIVIEDATSGRSLVATAFTEQAAGFTSSAILASVTGLNIPFNGLNLNQVVSGTAFVSGNLIANIYYR